MLIRNDKINPEKVDEHSFLYIEIMRNNSKFINSESSKVLFENNFPNVYPLQIPSFEVHLLKNLKNYFYNADATKIENKFAKSNEKYQIFEQIIFPEFADISDICIKRNFKIAENTNNFINAMASNATVFCIKDTLQRAHWKN